MKVSKRVQGRVGLILNDINSPFFTDEEKGEALRHILDLKTHNGVPKEKILEWCDWLWKQIFTVKEGWG